MPSAATLALSVVLVMLLAGCGDDAGSGLEIPLPDSSTVQDAGPDSGPDVEAADGAGDVSADALLDDAPAQEAAVPDGSGPDAGESRLVVVTLNTHSFQEGDDSLDKLASIGEGLAALHADLVGLNEVMSGKFYSYNYGGAEYDGAAIIRQSLEAASGQPWFAASFGFAHWDSGELMSNVVLSRTPFLESESRSLTTTDSWPGPGERRNVVYGRTEIPGLGLVNVFVTHAWGWESVDTAAQIAETKAFMVEKYRGDEALDLLLGDLNVPSSWAGHDQWIDTPPFKLIDTYGLAHPQAPHTPTCGEHRIDYVMAGEGFPISDDPSRYDSVLVFDGVEHDGVTLPVVSDHKGVKTSFHLVAGGN